MTSLLGLTSSSMLEEEQPLNTVVPPPKNPYHDNENISTIDWRSDLKKERKKRAKIYSKVCVDFNFEYLFRNLI